MGILKICKRIKCKHHYHETANNLSTHEIIYYWEKKYQLTCCKCGHEQIVFGEFNRDCIINKNNLLNYCGKNISEVNLYYTEE